MIAMRKNDDLNDMLQYAEFDHIKEMLFCMNGFSCSDKEMVEIINSNGGLYKYFKKVKARYSVFLQQDKM
jgi:hypothetical protein